MRVLIYGAGVIGSFYAALISEAGADVSVYARGNRLKELQMYGLRYKKNNEIRTAKVSVLSRLLPLDSYDFILLAVRENQLHIALAELKSNVSPVIVTMVNSLETYDTWEKICGKGRILPAFRVPAAALTEIFWMQPLRLALFSQLQSACQVVVRKNCSICSNQQ